MTQHVQVPHELNNRQKTHQLLHGDKIVYAALRKYMNNENRDCWPSITTISDLLNCSRGKVMNAIDRLVETGLLLKASDKRKNHYTFPKTEFDKQFEMFTPEFLKLDLDMNVKEYYMDIQQYLYGKETGKGKCSLSNTKLAQETGWTVASVKKFNSILIEKGLLEEETSLTAQDSYGLPIVTKTFDLQGLQQAALWVQTVTEKITEHDEELSTLRQQVAELTAWKQKKEQEESLQRNSVLSAETYSF